MLSYGNFSCHFFMKKKIKGLARDSISHCVGYRPLMNINKVSNES